MCAHHQSERDETRETQIGKLLETRLLEHGSRLPDKTLILTSVRLERELGVGDRPAIRRAYYRKLEALQREYGARVWKVLWRTLKRSKSARKPAQFFCVVVNDELAQLGVPVH